MTDEAMKSALTAAEWRECVEIARSGNDPLTYLILSDPHKAMCWINGNLADGDPGKITRDDLLNLYADLETAVGERGSAREMASWSLYAKLAALLPPDTP